MLEELLAPARRMTPSFELDKDHLELRGLHEFAAEVIRPAASEWDEREEFPWPVLKEAAKVGVYSLDFWATQSLDETGLGIPITMAIGEDLRAHSACKVSRSDG